MTLKKMKLINNIYLPATECNGKASIDKKYQFQDRERFWKSSLVQGSAQKTAELLELWYTLRMPGSQQYILDKPALTSSLESRIKLPPPFLLAFGITLPYPDQRLALRDGFQTV